MNSIDRLGPWPAETVAVFRDLGLTDSEIARYFRIDPSVMRQVHFNIDQRFEGELRKGSSPDSLIRAELGKSLCGHLRCMVEPRNAGCCHAGNPLERAPDHIQCRHR